MMEMDVVEHILRALRYGDDPIGAMLVASGMVPDDGRIVLDDAEAKHHRDWWREYLGTDDDDDYEYENEPEPRSSERTSERKWAIEWLSAGEWRERWPVICLPAIIQPEDIIAAQKELGWEKEICLVITTSSVRWYKFYPPLFYEGEAPRELWRGAPDPRTPWNVWVLYEAAWYKPRIRNLNGTDSSDAKHGANFG